MPIDRNELTDLVEERLTIRQIAARVGCTPATVQKWLRRYGLLT